DDRLGGQMEDGVDLELAEDAFQKIALADIAAYDGDIVDAAGAHDLGRRDPVADNGDDIGLGGAQAFDEPAADQAGGAGDQCGPIAPERGVYSQTFHGAAPEFQSSFKYWYSR